MRVGDFFSFPLSFCFTLPFARKRGASGEKSAGEIFEEQRRESDINTVVMSSRDFETIAIAMSKGGDTSSRLLDKRQRRGAAMHFVV